MLQPNNIIFLTNPKHLSIFDELYGLFKHFLVIYLSYFQLFLRI